MSAGICRAAIFSNKVIAPNPRPRPHPTPVRGPRGGRRGRIPAPRRRAAEIPNRESPSSPPRLPVSARDPPGQPGRTIRASFPGSPAGNRRGRILAPRRRAAEDPNRESPTSPPRLRVSARGPPGQPSRTIRASFPGSLAGYRHGRILAPRRRAAEVPNRKSPASSPRLRASARDPPGQPGRTIRASFPGSLAGNRHGRILAPRRRAAEIPNRESPSSPPRLRVSARDPPGQPGRTIRASFPGSLAGYRHGRILAPRRRAAEVPNRKSPTSSPRLRVSARDPPGQPGRTIRASFPGSLAGNRHGRILAPRRRAAEVPNRKSPTSSPRLRVSARDPPGQPGRTIRASFPGSLAGYRHGRILAPRRRAAEVPNRESPSSPPRLRVSARDPPGRLGRRPRGPPAKQAG
jgi:hypothetical protein